MGSPTDAASSDALPPLDTTENETGLAAVRVNMSRAPITSVAYDTTSALVCRERQLRDALSQLREAKKAEDEAPALKAMANNCGLLERQRDALLNAVQAFMAEDVTIHSSTRRQIDYALLLASIEPSERAKLRPPNFAELPSSEQWDIDRKLGILDWDGK